MGMPAADTTQSLTSPGEPVPVAVLARTSTRVLQNPFASLSRQVRTCQSWLPAGWYVAGYYWDIESGALDLKDRSQGDAYRTYAQAGIPRDGGLADLLAEAKAPLPRFAAVVCEDIERSARDTFNALKLEKALSRQGIPLFATDEPAAIEGINATTVLVRRVKQGVAEWYRLQLKEKAWKGLEEHTLAGWNTGPAPYGYLAERVPHPAPGKAAQGLTKSRLIPDPARAPAVTQIFHWRVITRLSIAALVARLNADPAAYPPPRTGGWIKPTVTALLANPKYTGHMVYGRTRTTNSGRTRPAPPDQWIWSPQPVHPALTDRATWQAAQHVGAERGNIRDPEMPTTQPGRRYILRSRIRCRICQRRMCGITRPNPAGTIHIYYRCPHDPANPRHRAAHPDHGPVSLREDTLMDALSQFFDTYVFGPDRAALLATQLPAAAAHAGQQARQITHLTTELARIDAAERGLISELEAPADPTDPATAAYRARYAELYAERTRTQTTLDALHTATPRGTDPALLDQLPTAARLLAGAPQKIKAALIAAFDISALYNREDHQVTIRASLTQDTPRTIAALLADPRTDDDTWHGPTPPARTTPAPVSHSGHATPVPQINRRTVVHRGDDTGGARGIGGRSQGDWRAESGGAEGAEADGDGHGAQLGEDVLAVLRADVGQHVAVLVPGPQQLALDIDAVLGQHPVDRSQHAGHVLVQVDQPVHAGHGRQRDVGQVDAQRGGAGGDVIDQLVRHELADVLLGLLGRPADVRGEDDVGQPAQRRDELLVVALRLGGEDVDGRPGDVAGFDVAAQRRMVDHEPAGQVEEQRPRPHRGELGRAEEAAVTVPPVHVQGDGLHRIEQLGQGGAAPRVAQGQLVGDVVEADGHAQVLGQHGQLGADVAVADDAQLAATHLMAPGCGLVPHARMHLGVLLRQPPGHGDDLGQGELHHTARIGERRVEHRDAVPAGRGQVDLVDADRERSDRDQAGRAAQDPVGDVGPGPDAEQAHPAQGLDELVLVQRTRPGLDLVALLGQPCRRIRVDVLDQ
jgi:site-specific DNA recombinase